MKNRLLGLFKGLGIAIGGAVALFPNSATQAEQKVTNSENLQQLFANSTTQAEQKVTSSENLQQLFVNSTTQAEHKVTNSENLQQLFAYSATQAEQKVTSSENLQQLQEEIKQEFIEGLKNSKLADIFQKHGVGGHNVLQVQCILDLTKLHWSNADESKQIQEFLPADEGLRTLVVAAVCVNSQCGILNTNCR